MCSISADIGSSSNFNDAISHGWCLELPEVRCEGFAFLNRRYISSMVSRCGSERNGVGGRRGAGFGARSPGRKSGSMRIRSALKPSSLANITSNQCFINSLSAFIAPDNNRKSTPDNIGHVGEKPHRWPCRTALAGPSGRVTAFIYLAYSTFLDNGR